MNTAEQLVNVWLGAAMGVYQFAKPDKVEKSTSQQIAAMLRASDKRDRRNAKRLRDAKKMGLL